MKGLDRERNAADTDDNPYFDIDSKETVIEVDHDNTKDVVAVPLVSHSAKSTYSEAFLFLKY